MSEQKTITRRMTQKIDTTENWEKATNFAPLRGELIIYEDAGKEFGNPRIKVGDDVTPIGELKFLDKYTLQAALGNSTFPYDDQGYGCEMEYDKIYTVSYVSTGEETIYFKEDGAWISGWFDYNPDWFAQVKPGDKMTLHIDTKEWYTYLYHNPILESEQIISKVRQLENNKLDKISEEFFFDYYDRGSTDPSVDEYPWDEVLTITNVTECEFGYYDIECDNYTFYWTSLDEDELSYIKPGNQLKIKAENYDGAYEAFHPCVYKVINLPTKIDNILNEVERLDNDKISIKKSLIFNVFNRGGYFEFGGWGDDRPVDGGICIVESISLWEGEEYENIYSICLSWEGYDFYIEQVYLKESDGFYEGMEVAYYNNGDLCDPSETILSVDDILTRINSKADLVDGKVPLSQLPEMSIDTSKFATKDQLKQKADLVNGKVPMEQIPDEARVFTKTVSGEEGEIVEVSVVASISEVGQWSISWSSDVPISHPGVIYIEDYGTVGNGYNTDSDNITSTFITDYTVFAISNLERVELNFEPDDENSMMYYASATLQAKTESSYQETITPVTEIKSGNGIILTNNNGETTIAADLLQALEHTAIENPADQAPSAFAVASALTLKSEGVNANYNFTTPGWKRVLNIIRATNGNLNLGIAKTTNGKVTQGLGIDFAGYVKFPNEDFRKGKPVIYQRYNNLFGLDPAEYPEKRAQITKVRIGYPTSDYGTNPVNCYVDIYIDFEPRAGQEDYVAFNMSYSGKAASHNTSAIIEETPATDTGIYGETLQYYEFEAKVGPDIYTEGEIEASKFIGNVEADNVSAKELFAIGEETRNFNVTGNFADVKVTSKHTDNTIQAYKRYNYLYNILKTGDTVKNGVTVTVQDSGAMTLNGTCTKDTTHALFNGYSSTNPIIYLPAGTYKTYGMRFLMWGINEDKANYETILPMNNARNQFLEHTFTITEPKYIGHASIYLKNKVSWNNEHIVPYLYRIDDTEEVIFNYDASTDTITIANDKVNIKITDRGDLYGTSIKGEKVLELNNTTILEDGKIVSNNYTTLVADVPGYNYLAGESSTSYDIPENTDCVITSIEYNYDGGDNHNFYCNEGYVGIDSGMYSIDDLNHIQIGDVLRVSATMGEDGYYSYVIVYKSASNVAASTFKAEAKTKLVTIGLNADGSIKASNSLKQAFKDWLGI